MIKLEVNVLCKESGIAAIFAQGRYSTLLYISDGSAVWPTKSCPAKDRMPLCQRSPQQCPQSSTPKNRPKNYSSKYHLPEEDSLLFSGKSEPAYILQSQSTGWAHRVWGGSSHQSHPHGLSFLSVNSRSCEDRMICTGHRACHVARHSLSFYSKSNLTLPEPHKIMTKRWRIWNLLLYQSCILYSLTQITK